MTFHPFWEKLLKTNKLLGESERLSLSVAELKRILGVAFEEGRLEGQVTGKAEATESIRKMVGEPGDVPDFWSVLFGVKK